MKTKLAVMMMLGIASAITCNAKFVSAYPEAPSAPPHWIVAPSNSNNVLPTMAKGKRLHVGR